VTIDVELMHAWMRADPPACCVALARLGADERAAALDQCDAADLALLLRHAPVWWLNVAKKTTGPPGTKPLRSRHDVNVIRCCGPAPRCRSHCESAIALSRRARSSCRGSNLVGSTTVLRSHI
jgi:hypothetical protein